MCDISIHFVLRKPIINLYLHCSIMWKTQENWCAGQVGEGEFNFSLPAWPELVQLHLIICANTISTQRMAEHKHVLLKF